MGTPTGRLEYREEISVCTYGTATFGVRVRSNFTWEDASGAVVRFPNRDYEATLPYCPTVSNFEVTSGNSDNGVMELNTSSNPYVIKFKDGTRLEIPLLTGSKTLKDANGNFVGNNLDTVGRSTATVKDSAGVARSFTTTYNTINVTSAFPSTQCGTIPIRHFGQTLSVLNRLDLPNGLAYTFQYDPTFGEINRINLPTGGYIRYEWTTIAQVDDPPAGSPSATSARTDRRRAPGWRLRPLKLKPLGIRRLSTPK